MPITLNAVTGLLEADIVDGNYEELENFLSEGIVKGDFVDGPSFGKYKIRRHTSGKITSFDTGSKIIGNENTVGKTGTFENNWIAGTKDRTYIRHDGLPMTTRSTMAESQDMEDSEVSPAIFNNSFPLSYPFELLGYPGGSLYYDFQEQGLADPVSFFAFHGNPDGVSSVDNWPPAGSPLNRFPADECHSRWLTVPDAAGGVYVDEPCVALITAVVTGNFFFTPAMRVHGANTSREYSEGSTYIDSDTTLEHIGLNEKWNLSPESGWLGAQIMEGMQHSAFLRLGLFVDTNPIVWDDEFVNGDSYGNKNLASSGHGFNPWIGSDPDGAFSEDDFGNLPGPRPNGVAKTRSWVKVTDITHRVRQRHSYKIVGVIELRGRRRYNFSLKSRPAMSYGFVSRTGTGGFYRYDFVNGYAELNHGSPSTHIDELAPIQRTGDTETTNSNPAWLWGGVMPGPYPGHGYFYPGGDLLATNMIENSSLSVEFFYGQTLTEVHERAGNQEQNEFKPEAN